MDPYIHTAIATVTLAVFYFVGKHRGNTEGMISTWGIILQAFDAKAIEIDDDGNMTVTYNDGTKETID